MILVFMFIVDIVTVRNVVEARYVFTPVCQSFRSRGMSALANTPRADTRQQTTTATDGTHPTGIHSCSL